MHVILIEKPGHANTGVGRYAVELAAAMRASGQRVTVVHPSLPLPRTLLRWIRRWLRMDVEAFFHNYPVWIRYPRGDVYHLTSQNLATLLLLRRPPGPTVVTVHDIIPWLVRDDPELSVYRHGLDRLLDRLAMWGVQRADALIADSHFTAETVRENLL